MKPSPFRSNFSVLPRAESAPTAACVFVCPADFSVDRAYQGRHIWLLLSDPPPSYVPPNCCTIKQFNETTNRRRLSWSKVAIRITDGPSLYRRGSQRPRVFRRPRSASTVEGVARSRPRPLDGRLGQAVLVGHPSQRHRRGRERTTAL